jgi:hypothetical protein
MTANIPQNTCPRFPNKLAMLLSCREKSAKDPGSNPARKQGNVTVGAFLNSDGKYALSME